ncbi:MAG TPA: dTMP kinase [Planctomycetes bacterium]|nr:dTMP kinase [Planctomycetota bacterium]
MRGLIIAVEGVEGAGKSTLAEAIARRVEEQGHPAVLLRDPGGTALGEKIRAILLKGEDPRSPVAEAFLFMAARRQLVDERILPAVEAGETVVLDRFLLSSLAYQGVAGGVGMDAVLEMGRIAVGDAAPDITILLDLPIEEGFRRISAGRSGTDKIEGRGAEYHKAVREGFLLSRRRYPWPVATIDAARPFKEVLAAALEALVDVL